MDSASCCGDTSALTLAMSQPNSSAYKTLAMASLGRDGVGVGTVRGAGGRGLEQGAASPCVHGALHGQGGEDLLPHRLLGGRGP